MASSNGSKYGKSIAAVVDFSIATDLSQAAGKRVLITGGASGLGESVAQAFSKAGAQVVIADLNVELGEKLAKNLQNTTFVKVDVNSWESQVAMFSAALEALPGKEIDILVCTAGVGSVRFDFEGYSPDKLIKGEDIRAPDLKCLNIGLNGTFYSVQLAINYGMGVHARQALGDQHNEKIEKSIVVLGSLAGYRSIPGAPDYTAQKYGIRGLFKSLRDDLPSQSGVRLNLMAPYYIETPMTAKLIPKLVEAGFKMARIEDFVDGVMRLSLDHSINGRAITVTCEGLDDLCDDDDTKHAGEVLERLQASSAFIGTKSFSDIVMNDPRHARK